MRTAHRHVGFDLGIATSGACIITPDGSAEILTLSQPKSKGVPTMIDWRNRIVEAARWASSIIGEHDIVTVEEMSFARSSNAVLSTAASFAIFATTATIKGCQLRTVRAKEWRAFVAGRDKATDSQVYNTLSFMFGALNTIKPAMYSHAADACGITWWSTAQKGEEGDATKKGNEFAG